MLDKLTMAQLCNREDSMFAWLARAEAVEDWFEVFDMWTETMREIDYRTHVTITPKMMEV